MYLTTVITITTALFGGSIVNAFPASKHETKRATLCSGLESQPQCCADDLLGLLNLGCAARMLPLFDPFLDFTPCSKGKYLILTYSTALTDADVSSVAEFKAFCAAAGLEAWCCAVAAVSSVVLTTLPFATMVADFLHR